MTAKAVYFQLAKVRAFNDFPFVAVLCSAKLSKAYSEVEL